MFSLHKIHIPFFKIWYSSSYSFVLTILLIALAVTPIDTIYQIIRFETSKTNKLENIAIIGGVYVLTAFITLLVYSSRLYTNRSVLSEIPKPYIPIEHGEVGKGVRRMITRQLERSALIAWDSRPRDIRDEIKNEESGDEMTRPARVRNKLKRRTRTFDASTVIPKAPADPPWGHIGHPGWSAPDSEDLANLEYRTVILELPNLIEAKAVSLAPPDPAFPPNADPSDTTDPPPDAQIVALLQRSPTMSLRDYLEHLASFGLVQPPELGEQFVSQYEHARFSTDALSEKQFRELMATFAELLAAMSDLDPALVAEMQANSSVSDSSSYSASDSASRSESSVLHYHTPDPEREVRQAPSNGSLSSGGSVVHHRSPGTSQALQRLRPQGHHSSSSSGSPSSTVRHTSSARARSSSQASFDDARSRRWPSTASRARPGMQRMRSSQSAQSTATSTASSLRSAQSVIRLRSDAAPGELPYQLHLPGT